MKIKIEISLGELIDKISILQIKAQKIEEPEALAFVEREKQHLLGQLKALALAGVDDYLARLKEVNLQLWDIEEAIRQKEELQDFGPEFIRLARSVYQTNDRRFSIKNEINQRFASNLREVKSY